MTYAFDEKVRLLKWLLPKLHNNDVLASELPFLDGADRADLARITARHLLAIEIKGQRDSTQKLDRQLVAYQQCFHSVWVACTPRLLYSVTHIATAGVGLILLDKEIRVVRKASVARLLASEGAVAWLQARELRRLLGREATGHVLETMRRLAVAKYGVRELNRLAVAAVRQRMLPRHEAFVRELGKGLNLDDLQMLTLPNKVR